MISRIVIKLSADAFVFVAAGWPFRLSFGGVLGYFGVVVNTPRKLHSAGPTNRDYPRI